VTWSIVVVTWECAGQLRRLVDSMNEHLEGHPELIVVDNASSDDPEAEAHRWRGPTRFLCLDANAGFGKANNVGVGEARGDAVVMLNPDTELLEGGLGALAEFSLRRRALAGPRLLEADGSRPQPSASGSIVGVWPWLGALVPGALQPGVMRARTEPWRLESTTAVTWLSGACVAGPADALRELGPFDAGIHLYSEDIDLGLRAAAAGLPSYFCPELARVVHHGLGSTSQRWPQGPAEAMEANRRAVVRRAYGSRRERRASLARRLNLRLRLVAKRALGREASWEAAVLRGARAARSVPELPGSEREPR
jgi:N-acetylglucosaminyl-diphospho-decaprenol L-rhamnosyltransferase